VACRKQQARVRHREDLGHPASSLDPEHVRKTLSMYAHLLCVNREIFVRPGETVPGAREGRPWDKIVQAAVVAILTPSTRRSFWV
jgi:hypothetical protein